MNHIKLDSTSIINRSDEISYVIIDTYDYFNEISEKENPQVIMDMGDAFNMGILDHIIESNHADMDTYVSHLHGPHFTYKSSSRACRFVISDFIDEVTLNRPEEFYFNVVCLNGNVHDLRRSNLLFLTRIRTQEDIDYEVRHFKRLLEKHRDNITEQSNEYPLFGTMLNKIEHCLNRKTFNVKRYIKERSTLYHELALIQSEYYRHEILYENRLSISNDKILDQIYAIQKERSGYIFKNIIDYCHMIKNRKTKSY